MKRAIIYTRVSTEEQAKEGRGLEGQHRRCKDYAAANGMHIVAELSDEGISGTTMLADRPEGSKLLKAIRERAGDAIVIDKPDRIGRDKHGVNQAVLRQACDDAGVELHIREKGRIDLEDFASVVFGAVDTMQGSKARADLIERNTDARRDKARAGKWVGQGAEPFGYRKTGARKTTALEIDPAEAEIVRRIFAEYTGSNGRPPVPVRRMIEQFTDEGVPTPGRNGRSGKRNKRGWHTASIGMILMRPLYVGLMPYPGLAEPVPMPQLAIIDRATWDKAQAQRSRNSEMASRNRKRDYLLAQHLRCTCGRAMIARAKQSAKRIRDGVTPTYTYYYCAGQSLPKHLRNCTERMVKTQTVEAAAWGWLRALLTDEAALRAALDDMGRRQTESLQPKQTKAARLTGEIERERHRVRVWVSGLPDVDGDTANDYRANIKTAEARIKALRAELEQVQAEIAQASIAEAQRAAVLHDVAEHRDLIANADHTARRFILGRFNARYALLHQPDGARVLDSSISFEGDKLVSIATIDLQTSAPPKPSPCCDSRPAPKSRACRCG